MLEKTNKNRFKKIYIEITNSCNLKCSFCDVEAGRGNFLNPADFKKIVSEIRPFTDYVYLHVLGEPLLHPELKSILGICNEAGLKVNITTNGTLIKKNKEVLLNSPALREVNFSLHCFNELEEKIKENYLEDIFEFIRQALAANIIISLRLWNLGTQESEIPDIRKNDLVLESVEKEFDLDSKISENFTPGKGTKIKENLYLNFERRFEWPADKKEYYSETGFCHGLRTHLAILNDGTVVPCCLDSRGEVRLGNIFSESLKNILDKERTKKIYDGFSGNKAVEELCRKCNFKEKFI